VILFVKLFSGYRLTEALKAKIRDTIRSHTTPRHVPAKILEVPDIPYTLNMKKVELAVRKVIHNQPVKNKASLRNPEILDFFANIPELRE
jgi:acetoacetyl-CoA synthetase